MMSRYNFVQITKLETICNKLLAIAEQHAYFKSKELGGRRISTYLNFLSEKGCISRASKKGIWKINTAKLKKFVKEMDFPTPQISPASPPFGVAHRHYTNGKGDAGQRGKVGKVKGIK